MVGYRTLCPHLTTRQVEVLLCVLAGDDNAQIASYLELSPSSVNRYVRLLHRACGANCRAELRSHWADRIFVDTRMEAAE